MSNKNNVAWLCASSSRIFRILQAVIESQLFWMEDLNSVLCTIPKVGSSFWYFMRYKQLRGNDSEPDDRSRDEIHRDTRLPLDDFEYGNNASSIFS